MQRPSSLNESGESWLKRSASWVLHWLFPDASNRLARRVLWLAAAVLIAPPVLHYLLIKWLAGWLGLDIQDQLAQIYVDRGQMPYWIGTLLVAFALLHNLFFIWISERNRVLKNQVDDWERNSDLSLFNDLLVLLPSSSRSIRLLSEHDFGHSFHLDELSSLDDFIDKWGAPEYRFHASDLEDAKRVFWNEAREFSKLLSLKSSPTRAGLQSVVPQDHISDWEWPDWVSEDVSLVNNAVSNAFDAHQTLVAQGKMRLKC
ncbi:hypothetical protein GSY71_17705 [Pusillimonas sp. TS35]|nr:hypothetical protein [Pusillimonas sp. TS35]